MHLEAVEKMWGGLWADYRKISETIEGFDVSQHPCLSKVEFYTICLEDRRFFEHRGFDLFSIIRATLMWLSGRNGGGASTIEQQLVRTISNRRERSLLRKIREIVLATLVSRKFQKVRLLRVYLGVAYCGYNLIGISKSSEVHFGQRPEQLTDCEAATLASLLLYPAPKRRNQRWEYLVRRRANYAIHVGASVQERDLADSMWQFYSEKVQC